LLASTCIILNLKEIMPHGLVNLKGSVAFPPISSTRLNLSLNSEDLEEVNIYIIDNISALSNVL
jgi:hypothetical protein